MLPPPTVMPPGAATCAPRRTGTYFCMDLSVTAVVIKGLAEHKDELGAPLCPCRHYDDKAAEAEQVRHWRAPCPPELVWGPGARSARQLYHCRRAAGMVDTIWCG